MARLMEERDQYTQQNSELFVMNADLEAKLGHAMSFKHRLGELEESSSQLIRRIAVKSSEVDQLSKSNKVLIHEIEDLHKELELQKVEVQL